jgi:hypothetical protein
MSIRARCSDCEKGYAVDDRHAGRRLRCKACGGTVEVPAAAADAPVSTQAAATARPAAARPPKRSNPTPPSDDPFGNMDALLSLEAGGTVNEEPVAVAPPLPPKNNRAAAAAAPAIPLPYASRPVPTGPRRDPNWRPPGSQAPGFGSIMVSRVLPIGGGVLALVFVLGLAIDALKTPAILLLGLAGMLMMLSGGIGCLLCACRESSVCALLYLFVPLYGIYYILSRLEDTKVYVLVWLGGIACMIGCAVLVPKDGRRAEDNAPAPRPALVLVTGSAGSWNA